MQRNPVTNVPEFVCGEYGSFYLKDKDFMPMSNEKLQELELEIEKLSQLT